MYFLAAGLAVAIGASIEAAPILLVEMNHATLTYGGEGDPPVRDWEFAISANQPFDGPLLFRWFDVHGVEDGGKTFTAPDDVVRGAALALASPSTIYDMDTAGLQAYAGVSLRYMPPPPGRCNPAPW